MAPFAARWVYGRGVPHLTAGYVYHRWAPAAFGSLPFCVWIASLLRLDNLHACVSVQLPCWWRWRGGWIAACPNRGISVLGLALKQTGPI